MGAFGEKLRKQREQRGIELDAISNTTKISTRMLRAIEEERFDQLPGGVFNKGFVRAYARQVGLNEEEAVAEYLAALRESQIQSQTILPNFRTTAGKSTTEADEPDPRNPDRNSDLRGQDLDPHNADSSAADRRIEARRKETRRREDRELPLQEAGSNADRADEARPNKSLDNVVSSSPHSFLNLTSAPASSELPPPTHPEPIAATAPVPADDSTPRIPWEKLAAALLLITLALALWTLRRHNQSAAASQPAASHPSPAPVAALAAAVPDRPSLPAASTAVPRTSKTPSAANSTPPDPDVNPPVTKPHTPAAQSPATFTLLIRADQTSWISITADGQPVAQETLIAPAHTSVRAAHEITIKTGNAAGISFLLNGKEIPASGNPGEVHSYTFDATGLRASSAQPANPTP